MPSAHEPRIFRLESVSETIAFRLDKAEKQLDEHRQSNTGCTKDIADLRRDCETRLALLEHKVEELRKDQDTKASRSFSVFWMLVIALLGAGLSLSGQILLHIWFK
jgi:hypothetical protein